MFSKTIVSNIKHEKYYSKIDDTYKHDLNITKTNFNYVL